MSGRVLIVSNRLPVTLSAQGGALHVGRSSGGLATGLAALRSSLDCLWLGDVGDVEGLDEEHRGEVEDVLRREGVAAVPVPRDCVAGYYDGFSNGVLWPAFHYLLDRVNVDTEADFLAYRAVNASFADAVASAWREGDVIWVHDYHLLLVPAMLRARLPRARIGFFLHVPFPSSEVMRMLPHCRELMEGLLGADLIGFHASSYSRHFVSSAMRILGAESDIERIHHEGRLVRVGAFPMGIDAARFASLASDPELAADVATLRRDAGDVPLAVGIDRLDYTKGLVRRMLAVDKLLDRVPALRGRFRLLQVAVPSRSGMEAYEQLRRQLEEAVGHVNGRHATLDWSPIRYLYRSVSERELVALYRAADVMLVTPLRDGMNLVAKEFVASRVDGDGVLVLSEFAGAAEELGGAVLVNPHDVSATSFALEEALSMSEQARRNRMASLRERVTTHDAERWSKSFLTRLDQVAPSLSGDPPNATPEALAALIRKAASVLLVLDYDGTLVPIAPTPPEAIPDPALLGLLELLAGLDGCELHVVSGRNRDDIDRWLGHLRIGLHAEHGLWSRLPGGGWEPAMDIRADWKPRVRRMLDELAERLPGSIVEEKTAGLTWHYRRAEPEFARLQARELRLHLHEVLANQPVEIVRGHRMVEVRPHGVDKGTVLRRLVHGRTVPPLVVAVGDDQTDEDLFAALPEGALGVRIGPGATRAHWRMASPAELRRLLEMIAGGSADESRAAQAEA